MHLKMKREFSWNKDVGSAEFTEVNLFVSGLAKLNSELSTHDLEKTVM